MSYTQPKIVKKPVLMNKEIIVMKLVGDSVLIKENGEIKYIPMVKFNLIMTT